MILPPHLHVEEGRSRARSRWFSVRHENLRANDVDPECNGLKLTGITGSELGKVALGKLSLVSKGDITNPKDEPRKSAWREDRYVPESIPLLR
ncbi:hypothetical protein Mnod_0095 [Methylobacterium nodulans ORS 2060]|uniref:Uncharacterized protein n=1 Tax=Methylobacterium nodulans (strain LMG 21967 / CNCM I-2342 / ORS 2060) TaxID=460265 RepID=B8IU98_METNO|nr:hypothetical protein Mnod_0095 [Methylobacterium nodulans ORS 2060]